MKSKTLIEINPLMKNSPLLNPCAYLAPLPFFRCSGLFLLLGLLWSGCASVVRTRYEGPNFILKELDKGVYAGIHRFGGTATCNVGVVDNGRETIVFDAFLSPDAATELIATIQRLGLSPIRYVINSHSHNDHVRGNQSFGSDVRIVSTRKTAETMAIEEPLAMQAEKGYAGKQAAFFDQRMKEFRGDTNSRPFLAMKMMRPYFRELSQSHEKIKTRLPDTFVDHTLDLSGPGNTVKVLDMGACHSGSDLAMYLPAKKILFTGDIAFNEFHPFLPDGDPDHWRVALRQLQHMDVRRLMPGHGEVGGKEILSRMHTYLDELEARATQLARRGIPPTEADQQVPEKYASWWLDNFFATNLNFMYQRALGKAPAGH
jgi:glyoxylase-like metal-dependent hydrolase (beta-lactamase superfamily II)